MQRGPWLVFRSNARIMPNTLGQHETFSNRDLARA
ncbi:MAG: hypothetical protein ACI85K_002353 [Hyphomicrobiaceae bacterium]|jgi:hypothetical protein